MPFTASAIAQQGTPVPKVLRVAFEAAETGFDPPRINDGYSNVIAAHLFEALFRYDHLARPALLRPSTAASMPEASADFTTWTIRLKPGIQFVADPAFNGRPRELVASDIVYSIKRYADPATQAILWGYLEQQRIAGLSGLRKASIEGNRPFDYDIDIRGLRALDRYTLRIQLDAPRPRFSEALAIVSYAVAREVVEAYGPKISEHPVGTGPFRLASWRRSSQIVLERNPDYRDNRYDAQPSADDAEGQALLAKLRGRRLPMVDRVEIAIIEENQPRWLAFLNGELDLIEVPQEYADLAMPRGMLAPYLQKRGVRGWRMLEARSAITMFNMDHPLVGGNSPEKVALRRAIGLAMDVPREIRLARRGLAVVAHSPIQAHTSGHAASFRSENGEYSPARANALLDLFGYVDRDGDGWRDRPNGAPLVLEMATQPDQRSRQLDELLKRDMDLVKLRLSFKVAKWPEQLKALRAGRLMMWSFRLNAVAPDGQGALVRYLSSSGSNVARFKLAEMDALYERLLGLSDGPERLAGFEEAKRLAVAYMPYKTRYHQLATDLAQPQLLGYRRPLYWNQWYDIVDIER
jgi:ABC-type transport system substrate-binding protein